MTVSNQTTEQSLSTLKLNALKIAWSHLGCDEDVDALTNELLTQHFPTFEQHRNSINPRYRKLLRSQLEEQFEWLCTLQEWNSSEHLEWFENYLAGTVPFRDLLGYRLMYPGRFFDRKAIGDDLCDAAFAEVRRSLQQLSAQNWVRNKGNLGFVLTDEGITLCRSLFPDIVPLKPGNPMQQTDELSIRRIVHERHRTPLKSTM